MGLDRDGTGELDGDVVPAPLTIALTGGTIVIFRTNGGGVVLEVAESLSTGAWHTDPGLRETIGNENQGYRLVADQLPFLSFEGIVRS